LLDEVDGHRPVVPLVQMISAKSLGPAADDPDGSGGDAALGQLGRRDGDGGGELLVGQRPVGIAQTRAARPGRRPIVGEPACREGLSVTWRR